MDTEIPAAAHNGRICAPPVERIEGTGPVQNVLATRLTPGELPAPSAPVTRRKRWFGNATSGRGSCSTSSDTRRLGGARAAAGVNDALRDIVLQRVGKVPLRREAADLLLAALDGDQALAAQLDAALEQRYAPG
jgi:hypothetical protein